MEDLSLPNQLENVKTFFRMLLILPSMGPVFKLEVPGFTLILSIVWYAYVPQLQIQGRAVL